jgi:TRAP-type mannitol/chloroaromatic compound transport system permease small subunit
VRGFLYRLIATIDAINERIKNVGFLVVVIAFIATYEVVGRYVFNSPTIWAWDINKQLFCALVAMGGGYALLHGVHVRMDVLYSRWSKNRQAIVDLATSFLPLLFCGTMLWSVILAAKGSLEILERASSYFAPPVYPLWILIVIAALLFLLQVIADVIRNLLIITGKK